MRSNAPHVQVTDAMSSLKQLAADVLGDNNAARIHTLTTASFPQVGASASQAWRVRPPLHGYSDDNLHGPAQEHQSNLTLCHDFSLKTVRAVLQRRLTPQCRVLLCVDHIPTNLRMMHRVVLAGVDAVLVRSEVLARSMYALGVPASRIVLASDRDNLAAFVRPARSRTGDEARRIIHVGDLEPEAGVADFLPCVVAWGERNPHRAVELLWAGDGCLRGVLEAQPMPANVLQRFPGKMSSDQLARTFLDCDILAMPALSDPWNDMILEALTAQLPVLGSDRSQAVVDLITHGLTGWIFNPFDVGAMTHAVDVALNMSRHELDRMHARAAERSIPASPALNERIWRAVRLDGIGPVLDVGILGLAP